MRGAGGDVNVTVGDPGGDELFLVSLQAFGILQRRLRAATEEEDLDLLVEFRGVGHGAAVDGLEIERRGRRRAGRPPGSGLATATGAKPGRGCRR